MANHRKHLPQIALRDRVAIPKVKYAGNTAHKNAYGLRGRSRLLRQTEPMHRPVQERHEYFRRLFVSSTAGVAVRTVARRVESTIRFAATGEHVVVIEDND